MTDELKSRELRSLINEAGGLELSIEKVSVADPAEDEVIVRVEAAPINPTDLALLFGPADLSTARTSGSTDAPVMFASVPEKLMSIVRDRIGQSLSAGFEGAGVVVRAGSSESAQALLGSTVAMTGDGMFSQYRTARAADVMVMAKNTTPRDAASSFVNPMTVLGMVETMRREGHTALVHTAAASNLGQILNRVCINENIGLVNIVRTEDQALLLREMGARYVVNSSSEKFRAELIDALEATGANLAFDAVGGGRLANTILTCMERAAARGAEFNRYGSGTHKQLYVYGRLDLSPLELTAAYGFAWNVGGWLLSEFMEKVGAERVSALQSKIVAGIKTTFASHYSAEISLEEALSPDSVSVYSKRATGKKFLINPCKTAV